MEVQQRLRFPKRQKGFLRLSKVWSSSSWASGTWAPCRHRGRGLCVLPSRSPAELVETAARPLTQAGRSGSSGSNSCSIKSQNWNQIGFNRFMMGWCSLVTLVTIVQSCGSWAVLSQSLSTVYVNVKGWSLLWWMVVHGARHCLKPLAGWWWERALPPLPCWRLAILLWKEQSRDWRSCGQSLTRICHATWRDQVTLVKYIKCKKCRHAQ